MDGVMKAILLTTFVALIAGAAPGENSPSPIQPAGNAAKVADAVRAADAAFWRAYNRCDATTMARGFTEDAEFYHDKTGLTVTRPAIVRSIMDGPCADPAALQLRREPVAGSERYYALAGGFAILSGEQRFLSRTRGGPLQHDGIARYVEIWQATPQGWQMRRVLSFDHRADVPHLTPVAVSQKYLSTLTGAYLGDPSGPMQVRVEDGDLHVKSGNADFRLVPVAENVFGTSDRWLTFTFDGHRLVIREDGNIAATGLKK